MLSFDVENFSNGVLVFRAENTNTHRHLTEYIGLDLEVAIEEHYHEVMELLDGMLLSIFRELRGNFGKEIKVIREQFPADEFTWREGPEGTLKLTFAKRTSSWSRMVSLGSLWRT